MKQQTTLLIGIGIALIVPILFVATIISPFAIFYRASAYINGQCIDYIRGPRGTPKPELAHLYVDDYRINILVEYRPEFFGSEKEGDPLYNEWAYYVIVATHRAGGYEKTYILSATNKDGSNADFTGTINLLDFKSDAEAWQFAHTWQDRTTFWIEVWHKWKNYNASRTAKAWVTVGEPSDDGDGNPPPDDEGPLPDDGDDDGFDVIYAEHEGINPQFILVVAMAMPLIAVPVFLMLRRRLH